MATCLGLAALMLGLPATALGAVSDTRAELKSGQLRVEGRGALPNATITVTTDSVATGRADGSGAFRVEATSIRSSTCRATVTDGSTSAEATLEECTLSAPAPSPGPTPAPEPSPTPTPEPTSTTTSTLVIVDDVLPDGNVGTSYSGSLFSRGAVGDKPVEYRIVAGRLPAGLSMTRSFGVASALITGTPTTVEERTYPRVADPRSSKGQRRSPLGCDRPGGATAPRQTRIRTRSSRWHPFGSSAIRG